MFHSLVGFVAAIHAVRIFALFSFVPLIHHFFAYNHPLLSFVLASYPLMQALGQIPFGRLSDRFGRRPVIQIGLFGFVVGGILCYLSTNPWMIIIGRGLQGGCAVGAPAGAWLNDCSESNASLQAQYYMIGLGIVLAMAASLVVAPLAEYYNLVRELFLLPTFLAFLLMSYSFTIKVPKSSQDSPVIQDTQLQLATLWHNRRINALFTANFAVHYLQAYILAVIPDFVFIQAFGEIPRIIYPYAFLFAILLAAVPLKRRAWMVSLTWAGLGAILCLVSLSVGVLSSAERISFIAGVSQLVGIFYLLLLLESAIPVGLKDSIPTHQGTIVGVSNTIQYLGMTLGSLSIYWTQLYPVLLPTFLGIMLLSLVGALFYIRHLTYVILPQQSSMTEVIGA
ncbi:MAG: MFS transporter [Gammaproteobacteria bacterium]|nr:MFS transporter [Gammaproteobacteria bacterium]